MNDFRKEFAVYADSASAQVAATLLTTEGVPTKIVSDEPVPGVINSVRVMVPLDMVHRARWIVSNASFTDEELAYFATGKLTPDDLA